MSKLLKAQKSAQKKVKSLREDLDGDELQSKEDKAALKKLEEAEKKAGEAIEFARSISDPRLLLLHPPPPPRPPTSTGPRQGSRSLRPPLLLPPLPRSTSRALP
jgi:hypothetical protein